MGYLAAFLCAFLQTSKDLVSKRLAFRIDGTLSAFASFAFALPFYVLLLLVLYLTGNEAFACSWLFFRFVLLRSVTDTAAEWLKMSALGAGDISLVSCFFTLSPFFLLFTSPLITGDQISTVGVAAVLITVAGSLILVYEPGAQSKFKLSHGRAILLALLSAFFFSLNSCFDRLAVQSASAAFSGFAMTALSGLFILPFVFRRRDAVLDLQLNRRNLLLRGAIEVVFMVTKLLALQYLPAQYVAGIQRTSLIYSIIGGRVIYREEQFAKRFIAGVIILIGALLILVA